jgi:hypothetical protein
MATPPIIALRRNCEDVCGKPSAGGLRLNVAVAPAITAKTWQYPGVKIGDCDTQGIAVRGDGAPNHIMSCEVWQRSGAAAAKSNDFAPERMRFVDFHLIAINAQSEVGSADTPMLIERN